MLRAATMKMPADDTAPVSLQPFTFGRISTRRPVKMFFDVELEIHGVPLKIHGFTVIAGGGKFKIKAPRYRDECGRWAA